MSIVAPKAPSFVPSSHPAPLPATIPNTYICRGRGGYIRTGSSIVSKTNTRLIARQWLVVLS